MLLPRERRWSLERRKLLAHLPVDEVRRLQRTDHDLEIGDEAGLVEADHVDTVYRDPFDLEFEFDDDRLVARPFADQFRAYIFEHRDGGGELFNRDRLPALGRADEWRFADCVVVDHSIQGGAVARTHDTVPLVDDAAVAL